MTVDSPPPRFIAHVDMDVLRGGVLRYPQLRGAGGDRRAAARAPDDAASNADFPTLHHSPAAGITTAAYWLARSACIRAWG
jgi:hypothetical protein